MTSVAAVYSVVARINSLKRLFGTLPGGADDLLKVLKEVKKSLIAAGGEDEEAERQIVHLSYDIVDAIADVLSKKATNKLKELKERLDGLHDKLRNRNPEQDQNDKRKVMARVSSMTGRATHIVYDFLVKSDDTSSSSKSKGRPSSPKMNPVDSGNKEEEIIGTGVDILDWVKKISSPVLYIVGKSGMGKSTCARRLFDDLRKDQSFDFCDWISINHNFKTRRVLQILLQKLTTRQDLDIGEMNDIKLIDQIYPALQEKKYMLVLEDVRSVGDWESIRLALPISQSTRVIITSSCTDFSPSADVYRISSMNLDSIRELLQNSFEPAGLEKYAETIFNASKGSPLLATIIGKSLQSKKIPKEQQPLLVEELKNYKEREGESKVLAACYKWLAPEMKPCFLYLSQFRRGQQIKVEKLYLLLAAENLIVSPEDSEAKDSKESGSETKESQRWLDYVIAQMEELANRKLVEVQEDKGLRRGNHRSYRLQFQVQEFCKSRASKEKFLQIVDMESPTVIENYTRRLVIHLSKNRANMSIRFESQGILKDILSLLIFDTFESAEEKSELPIEINDLKEFIHLRILKFDGVNFGDRNAPMLIDTLVLLRYLSFRGCWLKELPPSLSKLLQLETLDLVVQADCKMLIPNNIFTDMKRMLHLYFPRLYKRSDDKTKIQLQNLESLEILVNFDAEVCEVGALSKFKELRILTTMSNGDPGNLNGITGFIDTRADLLKYSSVNIRNFDCYDEDRVQALEKLLRCKFIHSIHVEGPIGELPQQDNRGKEMEDIVLDGSEIEADPMEYLGMFENLQSLVIKNDAIVKNKIVIAATIPVSDAYVENEIAIAATTTVPTKTLFCNLRSLKLQNLDYLEKLIIEQGAMPKLSTLQIDGCTSLQELFIPKELDDRLKKAQGDNEHDVYSIMPLPPKFKITE